MFTASPITPVWVPSPTAPDTTSPLFTPIRSWSGDLASSDRRVTTASMSRAASTARSGSSSWVTGAPKIATMASPMNFSTTPPRDSTAPVSSAKVSVIRPRSSSGSRSGACSFAYGTTASMTTSCAAPRSKSICTVTVSMATNARSHSV